MSYSVGTQIADRSQVWEKRSNDTALKSAQVAAQMPT